MQSYIVNLESKIPESFMTTKAANSLDIDIKKKSSHKLAIKCDLKSEYNIGLIVGSSGSGKTTLVHKIWGDEIFVDRLDMSKPIIDQFPDDFSYDERAVALNGVGLTSVPCWIRPAYTLSNGQKFRASAVLSMVFSGKDITAIDEWTSVVDRDSAKVMSHCIQKFARRNQKKIVLCSCHYDVIDWLNPDWVIDCNQQKYIDRRSMVGSHKRTDRLRLTIREVPRTTWKYFSKYHYLSDKLPGGLNYFFGVFLSDKQIGFGCYTAYIPGKNHILFSNRVVIHPDFAGLGIGLRFVNETAKYLSAKGNEIRATFSSIPLYKSRLKDPKWKLFNTKTDMKHLKYKVKDSKNFGRLNTFESMRTKVKVFQFRYIP